MEQTTRKYTYNNEALYDVQIAKRFAMFRREFIDKNQLTAANLLEISQPLLSQLESGKRPITFNLVATKLVKEFDLNIEWLVTGEGDKQSNAKDKPSAKASLTRVHMEVQAIHKAIKMYEATTTHLVKVVARLEKRLEKAESDIRGAKHWK